MTNVLGRAGLRIRSQPLGAAGVLLLAGFMLAGLSAPWLAPHNPAAIDLLHRLQGPSAAHWAGTDELGRDTLSRLLWGARLSLAVSVSVVTVSLILGLAIGGIAGYRGGWVDTALTIFAMNTFLALPGILLAIAYVREKELPRARELLLALQRDFPNNTLFGRELTRLDQNGSR